MRNDIEQLFPELEQISEAGLREKVIDVWVESLTTGGWTIEELKAVPFTLLAGDIDIRFLEHVRTCARMSIAIYDVLKDAYGDRVPLNRDHLIAGALLADVGKPIEYVKGPDGKPTKGRRGDMLRHHLAVDPPALERLQAEERHHQGVEHRVPKRPGTIEERQGVEAPVAVRP